MCLDERDVLPKANQGSSKSRQIASCDSYKLLDGIDTLEEQLDRVTESLAKVNRIIHEKYERSDKLCIVIYD
jgi:hypothetical protein